jgi:cold shock CspA family protein
VPNGKVIAFDEHVGLGEVESDDGQVYLFHCVEIADGSRAIEVGTAVEFELMLKLGRFEASRLRPVTPR